MIKKSLALVSLAVLAAVSPAQGMRGNPRMMRMFQTVTVQSLMMLGREDVQGEIKMTDEQKGKLDTMKAGAQTRFQSAFSDMRNGGGGGAAADPEAMMKTVQTKMAAIFEDISKEAMSVLDDGQKRRVRELVIQSQGSLAVLQPEVAKEVALTTAQKAQIEDLQNRQDQANQGLFEKLTNGEIERSDLADLMGKNKTILDESVAKVLTDAQRAKLKAMGGAAFTFKDPKPGAPGSFGRPGGGR